MRPKPCVSVVSPLKSDKVITFNVRLNLNNPRHREAWELLQNSGSSRVSMIVDAIIAAKDNQGQSDLLTQMESTMRRVLGEMIQATPVPLQAVATVEAEQAGIGEISDEDFDIADSFMSSLGM